MPGADTPSSLVTRTVIVVGFLAAPAGGATTIVPAVSAARPSKATNAVRTRFMVGTLPVWREALDPSGPSYAGRVAATAPIRRRSSLSASRRSRCTGTNCQMSRSITGESLVIS